jgi:hypothetical protein
MTDAGSDVAPRLIDAAFDGPVDVVGDVHGEVDALEDLLRVLGYSGRGQHSGARRLIFIGDLCDRGPDSPAVIRRVHEMVREGTAQCLLGNHELNLLRGARKEANGWFFEMDHDRGHGVHVESRPAASDDERGAIVRFFSTLPLALERPDLRLVHACWDDDRIGELRLAPAGASAVDYQMSNPVRVLTSGKEQRADTPFFMSGKWRMVERTDWWQAYDAATPVIFGHYWRWPAPDAGDRFGAYAYDTFADRAANEWLGTANTAFCVDYCVGARFAERDGWPGEPFRTRLAAVRWPERELMFDDGRGAEIVAPRLQDSPAVRTRR